MAHLPGDELAGGHRRILVVEDDPETAGQVVETLTTGGYKVDLATSGNEALSRGVASDYAVITIDRMLPDIDGIAVMRQLRDDGIAAPVLIISALGEVDDRVRAAGGTATLVPLDLRDYVKIDELAAALYQRYGRLDILVGNAAEFATKAASYRGQCCCGTSGIFISIPRRISSTSMSGACAAKSTASKPIR